jgi:hypothetical protein
VSLDRGAGLDCPACFTASAYPAYGRLISYDPLNLSGFSFVKCFVSVPEPAQLERAPLLFVPAFPRQG